MGEIPAGVLVGLEVANGLVVLISNITRALDEVHATIGAANAAGRDLTDEELETVSKARHLAEQAALAVLTAQG